jgi:hypothetical protein
MAAEETGQERRRQTGWLGFDDPDWPGQGHAMSSWGPVTTQSTAAELADRLRALQYAWQSTCSCDLFVRLLCACCAAWDRLIARVLHARETGGGNTCADCSGVAAHRQVEEREG